MNRKEDIIIVKKAKEAFFFILFFLMVLFMVYQMGLDFTHSGIEEEQIHQLLEADGITTEANVQECGCSSRPHHCDMTYQYQVVISGQIATYLGEDIGRLDSGCEEGQVVTIKYLAEEPTLSRLSESHSIQYYKGLGRGFTHPELFLLTIFALGLGVEASHPDIERDKVIAALKSNPADSVALLVLAHVLEAEGNKTKANDCLKEILLPNLPIKTLQLEARSLLPSREMEAESNAQAKEDIKPWLSTIPDPSLKPLLSLSHMMKLPGILIALLAWGQFFHTTALEPFVIGTMLVIGTWFILRIVKLFVLAFRSRNWPASQALVIGSFIKLYQNEKTAHSYGLYVTVAYKIKQKHYLGSLPSADVYGYRQSWLKHAQIQKKKNETEIRCAQKHYAFGQIVTVYYNPQKPGIVTDKRGLHPKIRRLMLKFYGYALFCWLFAGLIWLIS